MTYIPESKPAAPRNPELAVGPTPALVRLETADVDEAVRYINERTVRSGLELARDVGEYILNTFFGGDYANFASPSRTKPTSFRALELRPDLLIGKARLHDFIRISHQLKSLPSEVVTRLTLAHHRALLPLPDPESKAALARRALDEGWPSRVLCHEVRRFVPRSRAGRKPLPPVAKGIRGVVRSLDLAFEHDLTSDEVRRLGPEQASALSEQVEDCLARLRELRRALADAAGQSGAREEC